MAGSLMRSRRSARSGLDSSVQTRRINDLNVIEKKSHAQLRHGFSNSFMKLRIDTSLLMNKINNIAVGRIPTDGLS